MDPVALSADRNASAIRVRKEAVVINRADSASRNSTLAAARITLGKARIFHMVERVLAK